MRAPTAAPSAGDEPSMLRVIDCIYAAASGEVPWDRPVEEVGRCGRFDACMLTSIDPLDRRPFILSAYARQPLVTGTPGILPPNPLMTESVLRSAPGALWHDDEIMSRVLLRTTTFWTDWMLPEKVVAWTCMIIGERGPQVVCLEVYDRGRPGTVGAGAAHLLSRLAPHLVRGWRLGEDMKLLSRPPVAPAGWDRGAVDAVRATPSRGAHLPRIGRLRAEFGLTKAEARLAVALTDGRSPAQAAKDFDVKLTTIRSQLQQIFAKTGTSRQVELVAMLLARSHQAGTSYERTRQGAEV
jgi:DNA-binding CsgD family transcriptional regulator